MQLTLTKGEYKFSKRDLKFKVDNDILFDLQDHFYVIIGDNGVGKTSFIELVLLPLFKKKNINYTYIGQDLKNQLNTIKSSLAFIKETIRGKNTEEIFQFWFSKMEPSDVLILDEFDKYSYSINQLCEKRFSANFIISHNEIKDHISKDFNVRTIEITASKNNIRKIQLS